MSQMKFAAVALLVLLGACSQSRGVRAGDTQIVAQWLTTDTPSKSRAPVIIEAVASAYERMSTESRIVSACESVCFLDGDDVGGGTYNLYLYTHDVAKTVAKLTNLEKAGRLPAGLRIGVAKYSNRERKNWTYDPVYPPGLKYFDISYRAQPNSSLHR